MVRAVKLRAAARATVLLLKTYPMLPSRPLDWVTPRPIVEQFVYPTSHGMAEGDLYRPSTAGPHPAVVVCLGVVPFGVEHPQVPRLGEALARSGLAALLYWSPAMRDFRLDPADVADIASAYDCVLERPDVDATRSGLIGTCVGGAFALMGAADARIRDRVAFVFAYAPYASIWTLCRDIASASRERDGVREAWEVDPLTRKVYVQSITALLNGEEPTQPLLEHLSADEAEHALQSLPEDRKQRLTAISPGRYLEDIHAPLLVLVHDRDDVVIPVGESRRLYALLAQRAGVRYTEFTVFKHLDPTKGKPSVLALTRELLRFFVAIYPLFVRTDRQRTGVTERGSVRRTRSSARSTRSSSRHAPINL